jgi:DivIVA domain-containing protein
MRRKKQEQDAPESADRRVTPADVQQVEFRLAFRGYGERDVDAFLDKITEDLSFYLEENRRLRAGAGLPQTSPPVEGDADEIVARAREEAAALVRRAQEDAAAIRAAAGTGTGATGDTRAAVAPFLNREREFLQSLGILVQGHAEEIKQMVLVLRARAESGADAPGPSTGAEPVDRDSVTAEATSRAPTPAVVPGAPRDEEKEERPSAEERPSPFPPADERQDLFVPASASEIADRLGMSGSDSTADKEEDEEEEDEVGVVIESSTEPAYSSEGAPAGERRERSLRELFWGED